MTGQSPLAILTWAYEQFGSRVTLASSFGLEDVALIDMASRIVPEPDVFMLDTDLLFHETYATMRAVESRYRLKFRRIRPDLSLQAQAEQYGEELWARDPNLCCQLRKVIPLNRALAGYAAWITGIRREQSPTRAHARAVEWDQTHSLVKVNPLVLWSTEEVWQWVREHQVPYNPLHDQGFPSIGCMPCTRAIKPGEDLRAGRWSGFDKKECGLHL
ncbi:MAG: phosphoadenylyl-sulfate reductase [Firmicutes bacterium]|nr:phosphoadenylyl-sulfate reductase [Bacillota bacterium]